MILDKLEGVRQRIDAAARRAGRDPEGVELLAVTKHAGIGDIRDLIRSGAVPWLGENRVQDARMRREQLGADAAKARWRFIGHLQTNKVKQALGMFDWIDSVDSLRLAETLHKRLAAAGGTQRVLVQVKLSDKETQSGVRLDELDGFLERLEAFPSLRPRGLMAIAPYIEPLEAVRPYCRRAREAFERHFSQAGGGKGDGPYLSLGMSRDFEIAVEEGANLVRIGTALFGDQEVGKSESRVPGA